jgi:hypothetical protein
MSTTSRCTLFVTTEKLVMIAAGLMGTALLAQTPSSKPVQRIPPVTMVLPVAGAPLSVDIVEERTTKLRTGKHSDGTSKTEVLTSKVYRDGAGRMRTEMEIVGDSGESTAIVIIFNKPDGFMAMLVPAEKGGGRFLFSKKQQSEGGFGFTTLDPLITAHGKKTSKTESLGKQTIEGIEFEGERTTTTVDDQPSIVGVQDHWVARDLGLFGLEKSSGPDLESTTTIRNLDRHEPDPALFTPPADYEIRELNPDDPAQ